MNELVRMISEDGTLYCLALNSTEMVKEMQNIHNTSKVCSAALGRLITGASMMGVLLKGDKDTLTLKLSGGGPASPVVAVANSKGQVKGYVGDSRVNLPLNSKGKLDVSGAIGKNGFLTVIKDLGLKEPYCAQTPIISGEVAEDITAYYATSEQTPTVCALGVLVNPETEEVLLAGGFLIQLLPTADDETITLVEKGLIEERGRLELPGRPLLYGTTKNFLRCFSLGDLSELPPIDSKRPEVDDLGEQLSMVDEDEQDINEE